MLVDLQSYMRVILIILVDIVYTVVIKLLANKVFCVVFVFSAAILEYCVRVGDFFVPVMHDISVCRLSMVVCFLNVYRYT